MHAGGAIGVRGAVLTAVIIARDEEDRIEAALRSVAFADERLVLDSGSADRTVEVAESAGARVVKTDWPGFTAQKNRALELAGGDWVLSIDADEAVSPELARSILAAVAAPSADAFEVSRQTTWLGHSLRHGFAYPDRRVRLVRRGGGRWVGPDPHDRLEARGRVARLSGDLLHNPYRSLGDHLATIDRYSALDGRAGGILDALVRPPWHFVQGYILKAGFRDGWPGLLFAALGALYTLLKWTRRRVEPR